MREGPSPRDQPGSPRRRTGRGTGCRTVTAARGSCLRAGVTTWANDHLLGRSLVVHGIVSWEYDRSLKLFAALPGHAVSSGFDYDDHRLPVKHGEMGFREDAWMPGAGHA